MRLVKVEDLLERGLGKSRTLGIQVDGLSPYRFVWAIVSDIPGDVQWDAGRAVSTWLDGVEWPEWF